MYQVTRYPPGTFSWAENISTDAEQASAFYQELFGWHAQVVCFGENRAYSMFQRGRDPVAALLQMPPEMRSARAPSFWANYVSVDNIDALPDIVKANGGAILFGPENIGDRGRMLYIEDAAGAQLGLWQPGAHHGAGIVNSPGAMVWNELVTWDASASKDFYRNLFGWEYFEPESGYIFILNRGRRNGGFLRLDRSFGEMPTHWRTYFNIADIDRGLALVSEGGGEIHIPKLEIPDEKSYFAFVSDPAGAQFYLIEKSELDPWVE